MKTNLPVILLAGALLTTSQGYGQQTPPLPPTASPTVSPTGSPSAATGETSTTVDGVLEQYVMNPDGEVDGLLLVDGTQIKFPAPISSDMTGLIKPKERIRVQGQRQNARLVKALSITNMTSGKSLTAPSASGVRPPPVASKAAARKPLQADGKIRFVLHGAGGETEGAVLENGTVLRIPPPAAAKFESLLQVGKEISVKGEGTENQFGRSIEVKEIGAPGGTLTPIYESASPETAPQP